MNSDFMQQQAERIARELAGEADNTARVKKAYRTIFGRAPTDGELKAALAFIATEPLKDYEERKNAKDGKDAKDAKPETSKPSSTDGRDDSKGEMPDKMSDGMMAGVIPGAAKKEDRDRLLPVTPWGRYVKILLSSNEFLFVD
jgi:hypothetical protein